MLRLPSVSLQLHNMERGELADKDLVSHPLFMETIDSWLMKAR